MAKSSTSQRNSYRRNSRSNSPSASSIVTVKVASSSSSQPGSRSGLASNVSVGSSDEAKDDSPSSLSRSRSSGTGSKSSIKAPDDSYGHYSRWSQSSSSSHATAEHRRHSSFSKRISFGTSPSSSGRTSSPVKKRRPADINTDGLMPRPLQSTTTTSKSPGNQLSPPSTLLPSKLSDSPSDAGPRTPLLHLGQISPNSDSRYSPQLSQIKDFKGEPSSPPTAFKSTADPLNIQENQQWDKSAMKPLQVRPQLYQPPVDSINSKSAREPSPVRPKARRDKDKKSMLARALQRANDAVQLDNAQNYMGAVQAYEEACEYLSVVLGKSSSEDDKQKLTTIRNTYTGRIHELQQLDSQWQPPKDSDHSEGHTDDQPYANRDLSLDDSINDNSTPEGGKPPVVHTSPIYDTSEQHLESESDSFLDPSLSYLDFYEPGPTIEMAEYDEATANDVPATNSTTLAPPSNADMPPPLSPRRPPPPVPTEPPEPAAASEPESPEEFDPRRESTLFGNSAETYTLWQEQSNRQSHGSSHHSVSSENGIHRRHLRTHSSNTEAEFDAALDAAVEAAYDEGYEPYSSPDEISSRDFLARASLIEPPSHPEEYYTQRNSIIAAAKAHVAHRHSLAQQQLQSGQDISEPFSGMDSDEEERLLDEITDEFGGAESEARRSSHAKSTIPRQSDSSSSSGRTWGSSVASSVNTPGTSLSTVDEHVSHSSLHSKQLPAIPPPAPPPTGALPNIPSKEKQPAPPPPPAKPAHYQDAVSTLVPPQSPSVQDRRSSSGGQRMKRLKIETTVPRQVESRSFEAVLSLPKRSQTSGPSQPSSTGQSPDAQTQPSSAAPPSTASAPSSFPVISAPFPTPFQCNFPDDPNSNMSTPALTSAKSNDSSLYRPSPQSASPINPFQPKSIDHGLLKSHSSLSLRQKGLLTPNIDSFDTSPGTPTSFNFSAPQVQTRSGAVSAAGSGPVVTPIQPVENLFASEINGSQDVAKQPHAPRPFEPCPDSQLLRPFWLMRRFYQTIVHPRGGYLSLRIFIPREVWKVKNVKLKNIEDKIANCDLLTAALLKLGAVDTLDADAVLEEMQAFEAVLDQAQTSLAKKLGNDVGAQNIGTLFKDAPVSSPMSGDNNRPATAGDTSSTGGTGQGGKTSSKSYLSSWRKLRSKNSSAALNLAHQKGDTSSKDFTTMSSVPMTSAWQGTASRTGKREGGLGSPSDIKTDGPHASYMSALARLCDAAQILDQIARQVEDPGLKHSSSTHVGLELCARHAAEFFAFYICRFVLQDITMLADKFIKRASEWVLS